MRIKVRHVRIADGYPDVHGTIGQLHELGLRPAPHGGYTVAAAVNDDGSIVAEREAVCSERDTFCKWKGRAIAVGRLTAFLEGTEELRRNRV